MRKDFTIPPNDLPLGKFSHDSLIAAAGLKKDRIYYDAINMLARELIYDDGSATLHDLCERIKKFVMNDNFPPDLVRAFCIAIHKIASITAVLPASAVISNS